MITKYATYLNLDPNWKPSFSSDQLDLQRTLANQLATELKALSNPKPTEHPDTYATRVQKFNFDVDYLRQHAFDPIRAEIGDLLSANLPSQLPQPSPAPNPSPESKSADSPTQTEQSKPEPELDSDIPLPPPNLPPSDPEPPQIVDDEDDYKLECAIAKMFGKPKPILNIPTENGFALSLIHEKDEDDASMSELLEQARTSPFITSEPPQPTDNQPLNPSRPPQADPATTPRHPATNSTFALATRDNVAPRRADHSPLDDISPINQEAIITLLARGKSTRKVAKIISSSPPDGLGIPTTKDSVQRFERRYKTRQAIVQQRINQEAARQLTEAIGERDAFIPATSRLIQKQLFETTLNTQLPLDQLTHLARTLARLHTLQINDRKLALAEQKAAST